MQQGRVDPQIWVIWITFYLGHMGQPEEMKIENLYVKVKSAGYEEKSANNLATQCFMASYVATYWVKCIKICVCMYSLILTDTTIFGICTYV